MASMPSLRAFASSTYRSAISSMYRSLVYFEPLNSIGSAFIVALIALLLLPTTNEPMPAPPMISSSVG